MDPVSDWYSASVSVIIYVISYNIGPHYNGTGLYIQIPSQTEILFAHYIHYTFYSWWILLKFGTDDSNVTAVLYAKFQKDSSKLWTNEIHKISVEDEFMKESERSLYNSCIIKGQGGVSICGLTSIGIPMLKIRRSCDRLIFNMGIPIPGKDGLHIKMGPRCF